MYIFYKQSNKQLKPPLFVFDPNFLYVFPMESLSSSLSISISNLRETYPILNSHLPSSSFCLIKVPNQRIGSLKFNSEISQFHRFYLQALPRDVPDEGEDQLQSLTLNNGFRLVSEDSQSVYQVLYQILSKIHFLAFLSFISLLFM